MRNWRRFAAVGVSAMALSIAACAATNDGQSTATTVATAAPQAQAANPQAMDDAQLREYVAARSEIEPLQQGFASLTQEQQMQRTRRIAEIQQRHNLSPVQYNAIGNAVATDTAFASRVTALAPDTFGDDNLRAFAAASLEIDPISRSLATATPEQQTQATEQIRQILARNDLEASTYNAIAARAQSEPAFAQRIQTLHQQAQAEEAATSGE